jgi:hypothetical protein
VARAALDVAGAVERGEHLGRELAGFGQDGFDHVGAGIGEAGQIVVPGDLEDVVEEEQDLIDWRFVTRH